MKHIPLTNYCPGPVHTLISLVNAIIKLADEEEGKQLREYVEQLQLSIHYPAQEYEGNQCRYVVNHFISKDCNYNGFGKEMLLGVADIQQFAVARRLSPNEIIMLKNAIQKMHQMLRPFPQIMTKNKMHILFHHLIPFVEKFKSWGLYSEQSIESIHHVKNICDSRIPGRSDRVMLKREKFFKKKQILKNYTFDN
uniref:Uncharacterized protein n=1 Tax=Panagrolaimus sp. PS1159 TaxID=55785 RepID=A0AC35GF64_9BILA